MTAAETTVSVGFSGGRGRATSRIQCTARAAQSVGPTRAGIVGAPVAGDVLRWVPERFARVWRCAEFAHP